MLEIFCALVLEGDLKATSRLHSALRFPDQLPVCYPM